MYIVGLCSSINAFRSDFRKERENDPWTLSERSKSGKMKIAKISKSPGISRKVTFMAFETQDTDLKFCTLIHLPVFFHMLFGFWNVEKCLCFFAKGKTLMITFLFFRKNPIRYYRLIAPINLQLWKISTGTILKTLLLTNSFISYSFLVIEIGRTWHHSTSFAEPRAVKQNFEKCLRLGCAKLINEAVCKVWLWYLFLLLSYWKISGVGHFGPPAIGFGNRTRVNR